MNICWCALAWISLHSCEIKSGSGLGTRLQLPWEWDLLLTNKCGKVVVDDKTVNGSVLASFLSSLHALFCTTSNGNLGETWEQS